MENSQSNSLLIAQYLQGKLTPKEMHELEKQALDDPFLADALEGYAHTGTHIAHDLSILQRQLQERIERQQENKNVFNFTWQRLSIAAVASLMFISAGILFWMKGHRHDSQLAASQKRVEVSLTPADSITNLAHKTEALPADKPAAQPELPQHTRATVRIAAKSKPVVNTELPATPQPQAAPATPALKTPAPVSLDEVAITGYSPQRKTSVVGSVSTVNAASLDNRAVISRMATPAAKISGRVTSQANGSALPGVSVKLKGTGIATQTDANGEFTLPDSLQGTLSIAYVGYRTTEVNVQPGDKLTVALPENYSALNEVVVTGYGSSLITAQPAGGWKKYQRYLTKNIHLPDKAAENISGSVTAGFTVNPDGKLSNVRIIKSFNALYNAEIIRVLTEGPQWHTAVKGQAAQARLIINFGPSGEIKISY